MQLMRLLEANRPAQRDPLVRPIDAAREVGLVAARMRETLIEVLGEERGAALHSMEWLGERVRWHLDPARSTGAVFVSEAPCGHVTGHTIVRVEGSGAADGLGSCFGLFSTTFVDRDWRRMAIASRLLERGESWMTDHELTTAATYTASTNAKLIALYEKHGYRIVERRDQMVRLAKTLPR